LVLENNRKILNYQLNVALGLPTDTEVIPTNDNGKALAVQDQNVYMDLAHQSSPIIKSAQKNIAVADKNIEIINTDRMPTLGAFGGYNMQRPVTTRIPALDMYSNSWQTGISLSYNIDNLFKTKEKLKVGELQKNQAQEALTLTQQNIDIAVNAAYIKHQEAIKQAEIFEDAKRLANENYNITEAKYLNQLAVQAEIIDAQNQKLQSELDLANAEINVIYQYYNLLKSTGTL